LAGFASEEFIELLNQEYNYAFYLEYVDQTLGFGENTKDLIGLLDLYLDRLDRS